MAEPVEMPLGDMTHVGPSKHVLECSKILMGRCNLGRCFALYDYMIWTVYTAIYAATRYSSIGLPTYQHMV